MPVPGWTGCFIYQGVVFYWKLSGPAWKTWFHLQGPFGSPHVSPRECTKGGLGFNSACGVWDLALRNFSLWCFRLGAQKDGSLFGSRPPTRILHQFPRCTMDSIRMRTLQQAHPEIKRNLPMMKTPYLRIPVNWQFDQTLIHVCLAGLRP